MAGRATDEDAMHMTAASRAAMRERGRLSDEEAGYTLLELLVALFIIAILAAIAVPQYRNFINKARETSAISFMTHIYKSEELYTIKYPGAGYSADFDDLEATGAIPPSTGGASRVEQDYRFDLVAGVDGTGVPIWTVNATPVSPVSSSRWFYMDQTGVMRYAIGVPANALSPPINQ
jgi:type IV pilus assembly protein PilA